MPPTRVDVSICTVDRLIHILYTAPGGRDLQVQEAPHNKLLNRPEWDERAINRSQSSGTCLATGTLRPYLSANLWALPSSDQQHRITTVDVMCWPIGG